MDSVIFYIWNPSASIDQLSFILIFPVDLLNNVNVYLVGLAFQFFKLVMVICGILVELHIFCLSP